jgi:hypothetical protein
MAWSVAGVRRMRRIIVVAALLGIALLSAMGSCLAWWTL